MGVGEKLAKKIFPTTSAFRSETPRIAAGWVSEEKGVLEPLQKLINAHSLSHK